MIFSIMFVTSCGPSMNAVHGRLKLLSLLGAKIFQKVSILFKSIKERFFPEIVLTF